MREPRPEHWTAAPRRPTLGGAIRATKATAGATKEIVLALAFYLTSQIQYFIKQSSKALYLDPTMLVVSVLRYLPSPLEGRALQHPCEIFRQ